MKKSLIIAATLLMFWPCYSQNLLTLSECYILAEQNHPLSRQFALIEEATALSVENLQKNYYPAFSLNGQASYQSDVTKVPSVVPIPGLEIEPIDKDWYKLSLDLQQVIYDGGATKHSKNLEEFEKNIQQQEVMVSLYELRPLINQTYFNILLLQENIAILKLHRENLEKRLEEVESGVKYGSVLESNALVLKAELLKIDQSEAELLIGIRSSKDILEKLIQASIPDETQLTLPDSEFVFGTNNRRRPEYDLISKEQLKINAMSDMANVRDIPKFYGFGQAGIGRPALDMLNNEVEGFYIVGVKMNWNFWNWRKTRREREILTLNKTMLDNHKEAIDQSISVEMVRKLADFNRYSELIQHDQEIVKVRTEIVKVYESQLNNGVISSTEYLAELNAASEARLKLKIHEIQLVQAGIEYLTTIGEIQ